MGRALFPGLHGLVQLPALLFLLVVVLTGVTAKPAKAPKPPKCPGEVTYYLNESKPIVNRTFIIYVESHEVWLLLCPFLPAIMPLMLVVGLLVPAICAPSVRCCCCAPFA